MSGRGPGWIHAKLLADLPAHVVDWLSMPEALWVEASSPSRRFGLGCLPPRRWLLCQRGARVADQRLRGWACRSFASPR